MVKHLRQAGAAFERPNTNGAGTGITYDPEALKVLWERLASDVGVHLLLHSWATGSPAIGIREIRRVHGDNRLTREDVLGGRRFRDEIALCGAPIEDHHACRDTEWWHIGEAGVYGIPYRSLLPRGVEGVLVAGRCFSATHDAHASARSILEAKQPLARGVIAADDVVGTALYLLSDDSRMVTGQVVAVDGGWGVSEG